MPRQLSIQRADGGKNPGSEDLLHVFDMRNSLFFLSFSKFLCLYPGYPIPTLSMIWHSIRRRIVNVSSIAQIGRRYAHAPSVFNWEDPLDSASLFTEEELAIQESAHSYCQERMLPRVLGLPTPQIILEGFTDCPPYQRPTETNNMTGKY